MLKLLSHFVAATLLASSLAAQEDMYIRRLELATDIGWQASRSNSATRGVDAPVSIRYGAINSRYRFTLDQRLTFADRRVNGGRAPLTLDTQLGWRLGSRERIAQRVSGPYVFTGFNLTGPHSYSRVENAERYGYYGVSAGIGTRLSLLQMTLRPELVVGHDLGTGARGDADWVPARTRVAVRLGYGYSFRVGDR